MATKDRGVVRYTVGGAGYTDVAAYDKVRYEGPANTYKRDVMSNAYMRLVGPLEGKRVLDVGCGTGRGVLELSKRAAVAIGCDASHDMLKWAAGKRSPSSVCVFARAYAQALPFADGEFDVVVSLNFLHLFTPEVQRQMVSEMKRVLRPGGRMVLEFDNALQGLVLGAYKRWKGTEHGSLPGEIEHVIGQDVKVMRVHGAVFPVLWRLFYRAPKMCAPLERLGYFFPVNRLQHRVYYQLAKP